MKKTIFQNTLSDILYGFKYEDLLDEQKKEVDEGVDELMEAREKKDGKGVGEMKSNQHIRECFYKGEE